jgi:hypothetical protein
MVDYAGLTEEDIDELCGELEPQLESGICDDSVCAGSLALVRAVPLLLHSAQLARHRLKVCQAQLKLIRRGRPKRRNSRG